MSSYKRSNGDDYPDAARKNLDDAQALLGAGRYDGAGYHAGYVVECALKTLLQKEAQFSTKHNLRELSQKVVGLATAGNPGTARYIPNPLPTLSYADPPLGWKETMRYRSEGDLDRAAAEAWISESERVYRHVVQQMRNDGVVI
jgi:hypothetical protein